ncbi:glycosyltransferase family 4 protein [Frankia sp. AgB1.8]|uniref:glycosyltransferase family 4 protein n=1 Tax=Frankia sp. AgB1.8 TaxID=2792839 RepID=UPI001934ABEA|nr:glycosyltransferase family 4 protein [Frankia sp. AgB1.8]MBL7621373.1 glycosyltransferase family 4 protein [Frankia sp. AgB1.8]
MPSSAPATTGQAGSTAARRALEALAGRHVVFLNWRDLDHPQSGGAELFCQSVAAQFAAGGVDVTLLTARPRGLPATATVDGVAVRRGGGTFGVYPATLARLARLTRSGRGVDAVVDCQNGIPFFSPLVLPGRMPVVQVLHHVHQKQFPLYFPGPLARVGQLLEKPGSRWVYRRRPVAVVSPSTRDEARGVLGLPGPRFLVPNGVTTSPAAGRDAPDGGAGDRAAVPTIVCVGRLVPHKRMHLLIEAIPRLAARHPGLVVHFIGDGPDRERLATRAAELGVSQGGPATGAALRWHGHVDAATRDAVLASAWLTVNPSHGEGWGLSVLEAGALGVPAVAFRVPGLRDAVRDGETGWLVDAPDQFGAVVDAALTELSDPARAAGWRAAASHWAGGFTWETSAALLATVLAGELARAGRRDRRRLDDAVTRVWFPLGPDDPAPALRGTDLLYRTRPAAADTAVPDTVGPAGTPEPDTDVPGAVALLYGASQAAARTALTRLGIATGTARMRPASGADLLVGTGRAWATDGPDRAAASPAGRDAR